MRSSKKESSGLERTAIAISDIAQKLLTTKSETLKKCSKPFAQEGFHMSIDTKILQEMLELHSGIFNDVATEQLPGWGASNFLTHEKYEQPGRGMGFRIVAEWRSGSGGMYDQDYATYALRTWHLLAKEVLRLREVIERDEDWHMKT